MTTPSMGQIENRSQPSIWTIGHWTCPEEVFLGTLQSAGIQTVVDVRSGPGSRRSPQFSADAMPDWLGRAGIDYVHLPELGGRRPKQADVPPLLNAGWENPSFKNYADYTLSESYERGLSKLMDLAVRRRVAIMCAEPMPWRCHRSLIANNLVARGWAVWHLATNSKPRQHELGAWGADPVVAPDCTVIYPPHAGRSSVAG